MAEIQSMAYAGPQPQTRVRDLAPYGKDRRLFLCFLASICRVELPCFGGVGSLP